MRVGKGPQWQIWIPYASGEGGRWHNYWRWCFGMWLHRRFPAVWRFLKYSLNQQGEPL